MRKEQHYKNYIIFQTNTNEMVDYHFEIDSLNSIVHLRDYKNNKINMPFEISKKDSTFKLYLKKFFIITKGIN